MNILLKYFIFFLLGIIIYYFLFNSPNIGAKKLIEGFEVDGMAMGTDIPLLFIKNGTITQSGGELSGAEPEALVIEGGTLTTNIEESIFKSIYLNSITNGASTADMYNAIMNPATDPPSLLKSVSFKSAQLKKPSIPDSIDFNLVIPGATSFTSASKTVTRVSNANFSYLGSIFSDSGISDDNSIVYMEGGGSGFSEVVVTSANPLSSLDAVNNMGYSGSILIFKFIEETQKLFQGAKIYLLIPDVIEQEPPSSTKFIGPSNPENSSDNYATLISNANVNLGTGNIKLGNYYRINKGMSNIGLLSDNFRLSNQIDRFTTQEQNSIDDDSQYNLDINFPSFAPASVSTELVAVTNDTGVQVPDSTLNSITELEADLNNYNISNTGVVTMSGSVDSDTAETQLMMTERGNYHYESSASINIFQYVNYFFQAASRTITVAGDDADTKMINSIFLDMRIFNVTSDGTFGSQRGCNGGDGAANICDRISLNHGRPLGYYTPKDRGSDSCDPHPKGSIASQLAGSTGSCTSSVDLCCHNNSCSNWLAQTHSDQGNLTGSAICAADGKAPIYQGIPQGSEEMSAACCGIVLHGYLSKLYNSIKNFGDTLYGRSPGTSITGNMGDRTNISRNYIKYFIYDNMLNMEAMIANYNAVDGNTDITNDDSNLTVDEYDNIINFIKGNIVVSYQTGNNDVGRVKIKGGPEHPTVGARNTVFPPELTLTTEQGIVETAGTLSNILSHIALDPGVSGTEGASRDTYSTLKNNLDSQSSLNSALSDDLGPVLDIRSVETNFGNFLKNFGITNGGTRNTDVSVEQLDNITLEENMKLSLALLDMLLPVQFGLRGSTPLNQAFPEVEYNLATFSIYL
jgi:hypothetical protein